MGDLTADRSRLAVALLERAGWRLRSAEIDLVSGSGVIDVKRADGLVVRLVVSGGRACVERESESIERVAIGRRGDRFMSEQIKIEFIGRERFEAGGVRSACRWFADYLGDNAPLDRLACRPAVRALLAHFEVAP